MNKIKIAILASGNGSNAEAIIKKAKTSEQFEVEILVSNKKEAFALTRAKNLGIKTKVFLKKKNEAREEYDLRLADFLAENKIDYVVLAGFMRLLSIGFINKYKNKIINIHPSLLPFFPGTKGYEDAYHSDHKESGITIHFVDEGMDTGPIITQESFLKIEGESLESFKKRGLEIENQIFPEVLENLFKNIRNKV